MSIKTFYIKRHDRQPYYYVQVKDANGNPIDISGAIIYCTMRAQRGTIIYIDRDTSGINITNPTDGEFEYRWPQGVTGTSGIYNIEFEINPPAGGKFTVPSPKEGKAEVFIDVDLDDV